MSTTQQQAITLWQHQREAVEFAKERRSTLWHMGMGTGKSACAITLAKETDARQVIILCPLSVCEAWLDQFEKFGPEYKVAVLNKGSVKSKMKKAATLASKAAAAHQPFAVIVNYESARNEPFSGWAFGIEWDLLVMDESHRIKSPTGKTSKWVRKLATGNRAARRARRPKRRVALTGTVMPHSPLDVWAQFMALEPSLFGYSYVLFRKQHAVMGGWQGKEVKGFQKIGLLRSLMSRVTYQCDRSVIELKGSTHQKRIVDLSAKAKKIYDSLETDFCAMVKEGEITASNALVKLLRLSQTTSGRVTVEQDDQMTMVKVDDSKEKGLVDLLTDVDPEEPVVVFGRFRSDLDTVHAAAEKLGRKSLELSGSRRELKEWQQGDAPILAVQIQSGGTGIDLTRTAIVCYLSTGYSLGDYEQSLCRADRPGQERHVAFYHFIARDTVDERIFDALENRKQVVESVLDGIHRDAEKRRAR